MKKTLIPFMIMCINLCACKNEYNSIDLSNVRSGYDIIVGDSVMTTWTNLAHNAGLDFKTLKPGFTRWQTIYEECDENGKVLLRSDHKSKLAVAGTHHVNAYFYYYSRLQDFDDSFYPMYVVKYTSPRLEACPPESKKNTFIIKKDDACEIAFPDDSVIQRLYLLSFDCSEIYNKLSELNFEIASVDRYIQQIDSEGHVLAKHERNNPSQTWYVSSKGTRQAIPCIDVYAWPIKGTAVDYSAGYSKILEIRYDPIDIKKLWDKETLLSENAHHTIKVCATTHKYWISWSYAPIYTKLAELGYSICDATYYAYEKDANGRILATVSRPKNDGFWLSQEGTETIEAVIDVSGWPIENGNVNYNRKEKVFSVKFEALNLEDIEGKQTYLDENSPHKLDVYVGGSGNIPVTGVSLDNSSISLKVGWQLTLNATISPSNASNKTVTWSSSNTSVATVNNGKVSGISSGTAIITCRTNDGGYIATCNVTVTGGGSSQTSTIWNFSDAMFSSHSAFTTTQTINGLTIMATSDKTVTIDDMAPVNADGYNFTHRLKLGGSGSSSARTLKFPMTGPCTVMVYAVSNADETRPLNFDMGSFGNTQATVSVAGGYLQRFTFEYNGQQTQQVYLYSAAKAINLYAIMVVPK